MFNMMKLIGGSIGTNCYILEEENKVILIDFVPEIENLIKEKKYALEKILLTHIHFDHVEGISHFQEKYDFELYISESGYNFLRYPEKNFLMYFPPEITDNYRKINLDKAKIIKDKEKIQWNNHKIEVMESPGHSPDSIMYILKEKRSVFTGDTIFNMSIGRTDLPGGNFDQLRESINNLFSIIDDNYQLFPGHGIETSVYFEKKNNPFLKF